MKVINTYNVVVGAIATVLSAVFGVFWWLFALYFLFNVIDWLTGWYKSYKQKKESSKVGLIGLLKKLGYWAVILVAFSIPSAFIELGTILNINLGFLEFIGWFTLASLMVNEVRSILENLVETGYNVPKILIQGLAVTDRLVNKTEDEIAQQKFENGSDRGGTDE